MNRTNKIKVYECGSAKQGSKARQQRKRKNNQGLKNILGFLRAACYFTSYKCTVFLLLTVFYDTAAHHQQPWRHVLRITMYQSVFVAHLDFSPDFIFYSTISIFYLKLKEAQYNNFK